MMVLAALGLLTGWVLLSPLLLFAWLWLGGEIFGWMIPLLHMATSAPVLGFSTVAGIVAIAWSVRRLAKPQGDF